MNVTDGLKWQSFPAGEECNMRLFDLFEYYNPIDQMAISLFFLFRRSKDNRVIRKREDLILCSELFKLTQPIIYTY